MSGATERENEVARLRKDLESLNAMAHSGLPVAEALAEAERRLSALEAQQVKAGKVDGDVVAGTKETGIDQRRQQVGTQVNVARLYQIYQATPGHAELTDEDFQRALDDYLSWVEREYGSARLYGGLFFSGFFARATRTSMLPRTFLTVCFGVVRVA